MTALLPRAKSLQSGPTLCDPMECGLPGYDCLWDVPDKTTRVGCHALLQGIFPIQGLNLCLLGLLHGRAGSLPLAPPGKVKGKGKSLSRIWLFVTPVNCSPPGFSIHGVFQARILEWVAISFSRQLKFNILKTRLIPLPLLCQSFSMSSLIT